jgi:hypothetical protein
LVKIAFTANYTGGFEVEAFLVTRGPVLSISPPY